MKRKTIKRNPLQDIGIDIVRITKNNNIDFVQCKNYQDVLKVDHLAGFWMIMAKHNKKEGYVYHSTNRVSKNIIENRPDHIKLLYKPFIKDNLLIKKEAIKVEIKKPYDYQGDIIKIYKEY